MSNTRYLEIDSTYRDRNAYPEVSQFEVQISQSGRRSKENSVDPVCLSSPVAQWTSNRFNVLISGTSITAEVISVPSIAPPLQPQIAGGTDNINLIIRSKYTAGAGPAPLVVPGAQQLQKIKNYYLTCNVRVQISAGPPITYAYRAITYYEWLSSDIDYDYARIVLSSSFPDTVLPLGGNGVLIQIVDPTDLTITPSAIFIPNGYLGANCYYGLYMYNESLMQYRRIVNYDFAVNLAFLEGSTVSGTWLPSHNYSIRKEIPTVPSLQFTSSTTSTIRCNIGSLSQINNYYNHNFLRIIPYGSGIYGVGTLVPSGTLAPSGEMRRIVSYTLLPVLPPYTEAVFTVTPSFSQAPTVSGGGNTHSFEILGFSYDNACPFVYSGSLVSQQEMVCYQIELLNLILPNKTLNTQYGSRIAYYPYVYVELSNVSATGSGLTNIIYSNNPNSTRMIFRACVDDMNQPQNAPFIKIDGDKMVQTIKFKPNDNLRFRVILPNGELFRVNDTEYFAPNQPNDKNQITALFAMKRL
jgi:hypothetical protein